MPRFFLEPERWGKEASLVGGEAHHCARVMRAEPGDEIDVFDGEGRGATATVVSVSKQEVRLELGPESRDPEPEVRLVLAIAALKGKAMDWLIQKAVEVGAHELVPVVTERSIVRRDNDGWKRTALEACKQCGRRRLPRVKPALAFEDFLARQGGSHPLRMIASLGPGVRPIRDVLESDRRPEEVILLVGPEGDFTEAECAAAIAAGFEPVTLGPAVLRSETAALFGLVAATYAFS